MFIWSAIAHMVLPLGEAGVREIPNETAVLSALQGNIAEQAGLYLFPGMGLGANPTHEQKKQAMKKRLQVLCCRILWKKISQNRG